MAVRLSVTPDPAPADSAARLTLRTFTPYAKAGGGFRLEPEAVSQYPFRVSATFRRSRLRIAVRRTSDPYAWSGSVEFPRVGVWTIRVDNFGPRYEAASGAVLRVRVVHAKAGSGGRHDVWLVAAGAFGAALLAAAGSVRRLRR
jgi:hypothetical protein